MVIRNIFFISYLWSPGEGFFHDTAHKLFGNFFFSTNETKL
jgi:hypothetical protein